MVLKNFTLPEDRASRIFGYLEALKVAGVVRVYEVGCIGRAPSDNRGPRIRGNVDVTDEIHFREHQRYLKENCRVEFF